MMYNNKLVVCVKVNGKVLREQKDVVYIPFGSEYSILIKNLDTVRAIAHVTIDGTKMSDTGVVVPANGEVELERSIKNGNMDKGNRFKFIERTANIENGPRGVGAVDGLIQVEFQFEKRQPKVEYVDRVFRDWHVYDTYYPLQRRSFIDQHVYGSSLSATSGEAQMMNISSASLSAHSEPATKSLLRSKKTSINAVAQNATANALLSNAVAASANDVGITVEGSVSDQKFTQAAWFATETESHSIVLRMLGEVGQTKVVEPVTVKHKPKCKSCGKVNKANAKFCTECGTSLEIV